MTVSLETLELTPSERELCREAVRKSAYFKWLESGTPASCAMDYWLPAEREWIQNYYVPHRGFDSASLEVKR